MKNKSQRKDLRVTAALEKDLAEANAVRATLNIGDRVKITPLYGCGVRDAITGCHATVLRVSNEWLDKTLYVVVAVDTSDITTVTETLVDPRRLRKIAQL